MPSKSNYHFVVRATAFIMLFAVFHYVAGYRLMYSLGILYSKEEAKECVANKNFTLQKLTLSTNDYNSLKWNEENKEFSLNNQMYDVVSIQKSGDSFIITAYSDIKETGWVASLHNVEKEVFHPDQSAKGTKSAENIMSSFQKDCTPATNFNIKISALSGLFQPMYAVQQLPCKVSGNIWHPPANC